VNVNLIAGERLLRVRGKILAKRRRAVALIPSRLIPKGRRAQNHQFNAKNAGANESVPHWRILGACD
jgi:hypothetical protein